ncbi:MAG: maltodextrin glucosidase, partial [Lactobacillus apis]|nr:maltodextrin glucosidase [Lactobacillus apis]
MIDATTFRYYVDPLKKFKEPEQSEEGLHAQIFVKDVYGHAGMNEASLKETANGWQISTGVIEICFKQAPAVMSVNKNGQTILEEAEPLELTNVKTTQTLVNHSASYFGGGTQNGRFNLTGEKIEIVNTGNWVDQGVASPSPFYWSNAGYGV